MVIQNEKTMFFEHNGRGVLAWAKHPPTQAMHCVQNISGGRKRGRGGGGKWKEGEEEGRS